VDLMTQYNIKMVEDCTFVSAPITVTVALYRVLFDQFQPAYLKPNSITLSWSQTGPKLVADLSQTC